MNYNWGETQDIMVVIMGELNNNNSDISDIRVENKIHKNIGLCHFQSPLHSCKP